MAVEVLCIGHAAHDLISTLPRYPAEDGKYEVSELEESGGGPAANAAWLLSFWGHSCAFAGVVGDDAFGRRTAEEFRAVGTDVSLLELRRGHVTPLSIILVSVETGSRTIVNRKRKTAPLALAGSGTLSPKVLLFDGHEPEASFAALDAFPGAVSILDAGSPREGTLALAGRVDYLVASERFGAAAAGKPNLRSREDWPRCLAALRALRTPHRADSKSGPSAPAGRGIAVTLGARGVLHDGAPGCALIPARTSKAIDTTAAGDIFHGAFAHAILRGHVFEAALRFATVAAGLSVERRGGRTSIPKLSEVEEEMDRAP